VFEDIVYLCRKAASGKEFSTWQPEMLSFRQCWESPVCTSGSSPLLGRIHFLTVRKYAILYCN